MNKKSKIQKDQNKNERKRNKTKQIKHFQKVGEKTNENEQ